MAKTVVGLFDSFETAQMVVQDLIDQGFRREDISVVANDEARGTSTSGATDEAAAAEGAGAGAVGGTVIGGALGLLVGAGLLAIPGIGPVLAAGPLAAAIGTTAATVGAGALGAGIGAATGGLIGGLVGAGVPKEEAEYYAEGVRRGGTLVTVSADDSEASRAQSIMLNHGAVDINQRGASWRESGWTGFDTATPVTSSTTTTSYDSTPVASSTVVTNDYNTTPVTRTDTTSTRLDTNADSAVIPVVEEEIDISKRRVEQGGVRVTTTVAETPVQEDVTLREERVHVERRTVDRPVSDADRAAFQEGTIELTESAEEAVVRKRARVVEEVIIDKEARERTETVRDSVRRTDVNVEQLGTTDRTVTSGTVSTGSTNITAFDNYDTDYRGHYQTTYGSGNYSYEDYQPIYRYGHTLASDERYRDRDWTEIETDARTHWEQHNPGTWEQFKDTVRYAWDKARGKR